MGGVVNISIHLGLIRSVGRCVCLIACALPWVTTGIVGVLRVREGLVGMNRIPEIIHGLHKGHVRVWLEDVMIRVCRPFALMISCHVLLRDTDGWCSLEGRVSVVIVNVVVGLRRGCSDSTSLWIQNIDIGWEDKRHDGRDQKLDGSFVVGVQH